MNGCATCSQLDMRRNSDQAKLLVGRLLLFASPSRFWNRGSCSSEDQLPSNDDRARPRRILPTLPTAYSHAATCSLHSVTYPSVGIRPDVPRRRSGRSRWLE
jgi:hypothetical protein